MDRQYYVGACAGSYVEWVIPPEYRVTWVRQAPGRRLIREADELEASGCMLAGDKPVAKDRAMLALDLAKAKDVPPVELIEEQKAKSKAAPRARPWPR